jgi:hypothetical protein
MARHIVGVMREIARRRIRFALWLETRKVMPVSVEDSARYNIHRSM